MTFILTLSDISCSLSDIPLEMMNEAWLNAFYKTGYLDKRWSSYNNVECQDQVNCVNGELGYVETIYSLITRSIGVNGAL